MIGPHLCGGRVCRAFVRSIVHDIRRSRIRCCIVFRHRDGPLDGVGGNTGPIMIGPYGNHHRTIRPHQPFPYHHDAMHMVGHHHKFTDVHMWHVLRYRIPTLLRQRADGRWLQHAIHDPSEQVLPVLGADGQEIRTTLGVVVSSPSMCAAVRQVGHGLSNIGNTHGTCAHSVFIVHAPKTASWHRSVPHNQHAPDSLLGLVLQVGPVGRECMWSGGALDDGKAVVAGVVRSSPRRAPRRYARGAAPGLSIAPTTAPAAPGPAPHAPQHAGWIKRASSADRLDLTREGQE